MYLFYFIKVLNTSVKRGSLPILKIGDPSSNY